MIKNSKLVKNLEYDFVSKNKLSLGSAFKIIDSLWLEGVNLGTLPSKKPLEGIHYKIKIAEILNSA